MMAAPPNQFENAIVEETYSSLLQRGEPTRSRRLVLKATASTHFLMQTSFQSSVSRPITTSTALRVSSKMAGCILPRLRVRSFRMTPWMNWPRVRSTVGNRYSNARLSN